MKTLLTIESISLDKDRTYAMTADWGWYPAPCGWMTGQTVFEVPEPYQHGPEVELPTTFRQGDGRMKWGRDLRYTSVTSMHELDPKRRPTW